MSVPDFEDLLLLTSRTFALSIPLLEEPVREQVTLSYLLFRIADTFEDAAAWPRQQRIDALHEFSRWLDERPGEEREIATIEGWLASPPTQHEGYIDLLGATSAVVAAYEKVEPEARLAIRRHTQRTCQGMAEFVERTESDGSLELESLEDLKAYCYIVAGIVGEMLTDLFLLSNSELEPIRSELQARSATFGEALQLVNILKDSADDQAEGRSYLPAEMDRSRVFSLAREDLEVATEYVLLLQTNGAPRGDVAFTALPVKLAWAALRKVESDGAGAKISRTEVLEIVQEMHADLDQGRPAVS